ncbi:MAG: hypothetical protein DMD35_02800 [Gemmatimonadetes bacterium]|nr:MAG: hypothetical protein DMD35_02800 [Gemmatimonadota bacterium]
MSAKKIALSRRSLAAAALLVAPMPCIAAQTAKSSAAQPVVVAASARAAASAARAEQAPSIDGRDDDAAWRAAAPIAGFRQFDPVEDAEPSMRTEARVTYDDAHLYVFVRAFDPRPDSIIALLSRRDVRTASDQIKVMIDSYHDRRTGFEFAVNPAGVKRDYYTYDDSQEDGSWNAVWDVATHIDSLGWTAEFRIPLSQLRYPPAASHTFGVMIIRELARRNERVSWPLLRRSRNAIASQFGDLGGFAGLGSPRRLEIAPYALVRNVGAVRADDIRRSQQGTLGADLKYGLTSNLTIDATINPDFGQVEADPAQLNLTAFETFFEERRPFFLEGMSIFQFGADPEQLFYSRRIGRAPQLAGLAPDGVDVPGASRILGAGKLTGRVAGGTSLGVLAAMTDRTEAGSTTIEPRTTYGLVRATRELRQGESAFGAIATIVDRALGVGESPYLRSGAYAAGVDGRHRFGQGRFEITGSLAASSVRGSADAIARTQRSSVHQYQRPDDDLAVDTLRTSLTGTSLRLMAKKVAGLVRGTVSYQRVTPGYETNDFGFLARADEQILNTNLRFIPTKPVGPWRNASLEFYQQHHFTTAGLPTGALYEAYANGSLKSGAYMSVDSWVDNAGAVYCDRCARGGPALRLSPTFNTLVNIAADPKRRVSPQFAAIYTLGDDGRSLLWRVRPYVIVRPSTRLGIELGTRYQYNRDNTQWVANVGQIGADSTHYLFGRLHQDLLSFTGRMDLTIHPALSLQLYAEPFVTAGHFTDVRELAAPRAKSYDARFRPYAGQAPDADFNEKSFHSSVVARWEYRPGSTLFVVWTQGRDQSDRDVGSFDASRDYRNLFAARPENVVLIKAAYWIGR